MKKGSHRTRFLVGLLLGLAIGVGVETWLLNEARQNQSHLEAVHVSIVTLQSLAKMVEHAASEQNIDVVVQQFSKNHPEIKNMRVVQGTRLLASTVPEDTGERAAPRRLVRDEKKIYDLGQRLRAAVQTNREEGVARKEEIEITSTSSGRLILSSPYEQNESVVGFVQIETVSSVILPKTSLIIPLGFVIIPALLFLILSEMIGERRFLLAVTAIVLLVVSIGWFGHYGFKTLSSDRIARAEALAQQVLQEKDLAITTLKGLVFEEGISLHPSQWDVDVYRRPRGTISDDGTIRQSQMEESLAGIRDQLNRTVLLITLFCLIVVSSFGFGLVAKLISTIVEYRQAYLYTLPAMVGMIVLVFFPFVYGITLSFTGSTLYNTDKSITEIWTGLQNYRDILLDFSVAKSSNAGTIYNYSNFYWTFLFTVIWTITNVTIGVTFGLILALILNTKGLALKPLYRVLLIFPWAMPNYITALIWKGMFHQQFGVINQVLQIFGGNPIAWFEKPFTSFLTALATNGWLSFPFMMVVSLGALQSISGDLYEAARVDGATRWQQFRSITLPSLKPALIPAIILSVIWTFNMFNIIFLVTQGEPGGSTEILITEAYKIAFEKYRYGYAAAYSTVIFMILLIYGSIQNRITRATEAIAG